MQAGETDEWAEAVATIGAFVDGAIRADDVTWRLLLALGRDGADVFARDLVGLGLRVLDRLAE